MRRTERDALSISRVWEKVAGTARPVGVASHGGDCERFMEVRSSRWLVAGAFAVYLILSALLPAVDDEVYYWCWSKELQWSYYDHPPMTAVLIYLSTSVFGDTVFGFRFFACVASAFAIYVIDRLTPFKPFVWALIFSPLFTIGAVLMTPDSPLVMCWAAYLWWLVELQRRFAPGEVPSESGAQQPVTSEIESRTDTGLIGTPKFTDSVPFVWWLVGGIILGCGGLSKYTMAIAVPSGFVSLLLARQPLRRWLFGYLMHGVIAVFVASPILIYNVTQNFEPLLYQWRHAAERTPNALISSADFVGVQMLLFGTMPFVLFPWVCRHAFTLSRTARLRVCLCLYALPLAFFLYKSAQTRLQGNWALVCFLSFWPLASEWYQTVRASRTWRWLTAASFLPPAISVLAVTIHLIQPLPFVPHRGDRVYRQIALNRTAKEIADVVRQQRESLPVYTDSYQMTSLLRFESLPAQQIDGLTRPSHFTRPPRHLTDVDRAYVVTEHPLPDEYCEGFATPILITTIPVVYRGKTDKTLSVRLYTRASHEQPAGDHAPKDKESQDLPQ